jgi:hypothetical protein
MADELSEVERRMIAMADELRDHAEKPEALLVVSPLEEALRKAAELLGECRRAMEAWLHYHDVQTYVAYLPAINATQDFMAKLKRKGGPSGGG